ncbi:MAG: DUF808 domain-containing protein [Intrasporangium sp.]|uniref:DUF808 domain-containing protein n=1 Tax=Intrasporangium sp. TaxID=1925024 RepID=UPI0026499636|nr:DUF808 domain-containing protein [Intrasporangium sp.]MDN5797192.1 DUF808 domain-containing protein [Intrasporangium sp.]
MAVGLVALLDDVAALVKLAAASVDDVGAAAGRASVKATGVVVDDTAVTPRYVQGLAPERELPIIKRIAVGSLRNKIVIILPVILLLSQFIPWLLTPLLMIGGAYLCFEGAERIWEAASGHHEEKPPAGAAASQEEAVVSGAIRTDFILSAEIMVIALNEVSAEAFWTRAAVLVIVALLITALVYGVVGLIVKMDDMGLRLAANESSALQRTGRLLVKGMPVVLQVLSTVGIAAMLWVGGHILVDGFDKLGWHGPLALIHVLEETGHAVPGVGAILGWLMGTIGSAIFGLVVGALIVGLLHLVPRRGSAQETSRS